MDIIPTTDSYAPEYPKKQTSLPPDTVEIQAEAGAVCYPAPLTKTDCRLARRILREGMRSMMMQLMGGTPLELGAEEAKAQERRYRGYERAYEKLMRRLEYWLR